MVDFIEYYDDALDATLCQQIIERFESQQQLQYEGVTGQGVDKSRKDSRDLNLTKQQDWVPTNQLLLNVLTEKLCEYVQKYRFLVAGALSPTILHAETQEPFVLNESNFDDLTAEQLASLVHLFYRPGPLLLQAYEQGVGGYHHWHFETYPRDQNCEVLHRALLFMFYLNTVEDGGETEFYYQERMIAPQVGRMVIAPAYFTHTHKGHVPQSDNKYIITSWVLFQRAENIFKLNQPAG